MKRKLPPDLLLPCLPALAGILLLGGLQMISLVPADDTALRYAPMARAFAAGNWEYAFHPHSGILFSLLCGSFALIPGVDGFHGCKLAALLVWGLAAIPFYHIALHLWHDRKTALLCEILYLLCSHLQRFVYDGLRDNGRSLGLFLVLLGILILMEKKDSWKAVFITASGVFVLMTLRGDCAVFGVLGILLFMVLDIRAHHWHCLRSGILTALCFVLLSPQLCFVRSRTGYFVPNSHYANFCRKIGIPPAGENK